jgi:hypothetical protein
MAGGGGTNTVTRTELDPTMRPFVEYGLKEAKSLYESELPQFYPGQTYVGPSQTTQQAMQMAQQRALSGSPLVQGAQQTAGALQTAVNPALGGFADVFNRSMFNPGQNMYSGLAGGQFADTQNMQRANQLYGQAGAGDPSAGFYQAMQSGQMQNAATPMAGQTASGAYLGGNPFFQGAFNPAARAAEQQYSDAMQRVNSQASQAGRYGSNAMGQLQDRATGAFAQALTDTAGKLAYENYGQERGLQESAIGRLGALSQQDIANRMSGAQGLTAGSQQTLANQMAAMQASAGLSQQDISNRMAGAGALTQGYQAGLGNQLQAMGGMAGTAGQDYARQLQAAGMAPGLAGQDYADIQRLMDLGQTQESYQEMSLADAMNRFNFEQMQPYNKLQSYLSASYGAPQGMQTTQPIYRNQFGSAIGGGLTGLALGGPLGGLGGAALGGLLG